jgi:hypothetical protein
MEGGRVKDYTLDLVKGYLRRYVAYPDEHSLTAHVLWIAHCYLIDEFSITPRFAFMSQEMRSGKCFRCYRMASCSFFRLPQP